MGTGIGRVLITGAAGAVGRVLRPAIAGRYLLRASDLVATVPLEQDEDEIRADLRVPSEVMAAMHDVDVVVHLGGIANEHDWEMISAVNIGGTHAVLEAAMQAGVRRVILASSVHAVGFHARSYRIGTDVVPRPDSFYGVSKVAAEALGSLYAEKWELEVACLRIASFQERPRDRRHLSTWLSHGDMVRLITACIDAPTLSPLSLSNFCVINAISANTRRWMDESGWAHLGYVPVDDAEHFAGEVEHLHGEDDDVTERVQGGFFAAPSYRGLGS